jgi:hypothetical protein
MFSPVNPTPSIPLIKWHFSMRIHTIITGALAVEQDVVGCVDGRDERARVELIRPRALLCRAMYRSCVDPSRMGIWIGSVWIR